MKNPLVFSSTYTLPINEPGTLILNALLDSPNGQVVKLAFTFPLDGIAPQVPPPYCQDFIGATAYVTDWIRKNAPELLDQVR